METVEASGIEEAAADEASITYVGQWNGLISTTNWEKGRIICEWRESLREAGASLQQSSDEAWSRRAGQVSPQHVGRLRRVHERFGGVRNEYAGLYWSHFQAALDFNDAEMWLEGAVQNDWSVSEMRLARWEAMGASPKQKPREEDIVSAELDEDAGPGASADFEGQPASVREVDFGDESEGQNEADDNSDESMTAETAAHVQEEATKPVRPFADLAELPDDLQAPFEALKLAILRHKLAGWADVRRNDVLASLEALKQLAMAPADSD